MPDTEWAQIILNVGSREHAVLPITNAPEWPLVHLPNHQCNQCDSYSCHVCLCQSSSDYTLISPGVSRRTHLYLSLSGCTTHNAIVVKPYLDISGPNNKCGRQQLYRYYDACIFFSSPLTPSSWKPMGAYSALWLLMLWCLSMKPSVSMIKYSLYWSSFIPKYYIVSEQH